MCLAGWKSIKNGGMKVQKQTKKEEETAEIMEQRET